MHLGKVQEQEKHANDKTQTSQVVPLVLATRALESLPTTHVSHIGVHVSSYLEELDHDEAAHGGSGSGDGGDDLPGDHLHLVAGSFFNPDRKQKIQRSTQNTKIT